MWNIAFIQFDTEMREKTTGVGLQDKSKRGQQRRLISWILFNFLSWWIDLLIDMLSIKLKMLSNHHYFYIHVLCLSNRKEKLMKYFSAGERLCFKTQDRKARFVNLTSEEVILKFWKSCLKISSFVGLLCFLVQHPTRDQLHQKMTVHLRY